MNEKRITSQLSRKDLLNLMAALLRSGKLTEATLAGVLQGVGLSPPQMWGLILLVRAGGRLSHKRLAERTGTAKSNITKLVDRLEESSLAKRVPDPDDRRGVIAEITPEGRRRHVEALKLTGQAESALLSRLTPRDRTELTRLLSLLGEDADP